MLLLGLSALPIAGCRQSDAPVDVGTPQPVSGRVTVGGRPAAGVVVCLHPLNRYNDPDAPHPKGTTDPEGRFQLGTDGDQDGAPRGQYVATLVWPGAGGADRLGGAFAEPDGSGLIVIIDETISELPPFAIDAAALRQSPAR